MVGLTIPKSIGADLPSLPFSNTGSVQDFRTKMSEAERQASEASTKATQAGEREAQLRQAKSAEYAPVMEKMGKRIEEEQAKTVAPLEAIPEYQKTTISPEQTKEAFSTFMAFAMLGGALTRQPMLAAMKNMTAAMQGYKEGDAARIKEELDSFDRNFKVAQAKRSGQIEERKAALEKYKGDIQGLELAEKQIALKYEDQIAAELARKGDFNSLAKHYDSLAKNYETAIHHADQVEQQNRRLDATIRAQLTKAEAGDKKYFQDKTTGKIYHQVGGKFVELAVPPGVQLSELTGKSKGGETGATVDDVKKYLNVDFGTGKQADTKNDQAAGIANATAEALALQNYVHKHPDVVGRVGQTKSFIDRYVKSLDSTGSETGATPTAETAQEQEALLFAKRYAAYLIRYEQALAGSAKGFTVQFMKRFNELMQSNQFNPDGFDRLMSEQMREYKSSAGKLSTKINLDDLMKYGIAQTQDPDAIEGYSNFKQKHGVQTPAAPEKVLHTPKSSASGIQPPKSTLDKSYLRERAQARIDAGAKQEDVKARYKELTGEEF